MADEATTETTVTETVAEDTLVAEPAGGADQTAATTPEVEANADATETETAERTYTKAELDKVKREAQKLRQRLKDETETAAKTSAEAAEKALAERIGKALGLIEDDKPADPATLLEQAAEREAQIANERDAYRAEIAAYKLEQALTKAANSVDGDLDILVPFLRGTGALDKLDATAEDYTAQVAELVASAVESNPKLRKATPVVAPTRSGGDINGGTGAPKKGPRTVEDFIREAREQRERDNN